MKNFLQILNYYKMRNRGDKLSLDMQMYGFFFIVFGGSVFWFLQRLLYYVVFGKEWGLPLSQASEFVLSDSLLIIELMFAVFLAVKLKGRFFDFYISLYPSIKLTVYIFSTLLFLLMYYLMGPSSNYHSHIELVGNSMTILLYISMFYFPARSLLVSQNK